MERRGEETVSADVVVLVATESVVRWATDFVCVVALDLRPVRTSEPSWGRGDALTSHSSMFGPQAAIFPLRTHLQPFIVFFPQFPPETLMFRDSVSGSNPCDG